MVVTVNNLTCLCHLGNNDYTKEISILSGGDAFDEAQKTPWRLIINEYQWEGKADISLSWSRILVVVHHNIPWQQTNVLDKASNISTWA